MSFLERSPRTIAMTLRVLGRLLTYPGDELRSHAGEMHSAIRAERVLSGERRLEIDSLIERLRTSRPLDVEAEYVECFDRGRGTSLHLFEHVHGDSRERGPAMIDLARTYEQAGLFLAPGELPDFLPVVVEYASTQPPAQAVALLGEIAHLLKPIFSALVDRESAYASVVAALLELAGEKAEAVKPSDEPALDESWEEPPAFGGCSTTGPSRPGQPQTIAIVARRGAATDGARP
jgi:nitrate reductase molybdenum cofactor assembly chaperone NarJ/NarW